MTITPNIALQVPATDSSDWQQQVNYNLNRLDSLLSGNLPIPGLVVNGPITASILTTESLVVSPTMWLGTRNMAAISDRWNCRVARN